MAACRGKAVVGSRKIGIGRLMVEVACILKRGMAEVDYNLKAVIVQN